ncbi:MAG: DUF1287 domain-containing protein [Pseudomonadota bacterium]
MQTRSLTPATLFSLTLALLLLPAPVTKAAAKSAAEPAFGQKLARAASAQRWVPVIYNPAYVKLKYPGGDVPWYTGVCTDVVVRAYRKLGIDLQVKVHKARVGSGDRNIDHRRVNVLRKFFKRHGTSLKVTKNPNNYKPGDLVTYYMPDGTFSKTHIAIVSEQKASDGTPLVIHNRGFGVQLENWLFAEKITGHYRYR